MMGFYQLRGLVFCYLWQIIANIPNLQNEIVIWITFFAPEHRQGRLVELSAAVGFLRGIHFIKVAA